MLIASASTEVRCHVWGQGTLQNVYAPTTAANVPINSISWGKDWSWMVVVPKTGKAELISFTGNVVKSFGTVKGIQYPTCACFQNTTKKYVAVGTTTGQLLMYDIKTRVIKKKFPHAPSSIFKVDFCVKDSHVVAGCENGELFMYNTNSTNLSGTFKVPNSRTLTNFRCHPLKRNLIGGCSEEGIVAVWDINTSRCIATIRAHSALVKDLAFSTTRSDLLVSLGMDRRLSFYDTLSNKIVADIATQKTPTAIDFAPDGICIAVGFSDGRIETYDTRNLKENLINYAGHTSQITQLLFEKSIEEKGSELSIQDETKDSNLEKDESRKMNNSYSNMFCGDYLPDIKEDEISAQNSKADSFMDAIGLNSLNGSASFKIANSPMINKIDHAGGSPSFVGEPEPRPSDARKSVSFKTHVDHFVQTQLASTPNHLDKTTLFSPVSSNVGISPIALNDLIKNIPTINEPIVDGSYKQVVRDIVREELHIFGRDQIHWELGRTVRQQFLDVQMTLAHLYCDFEEKFERLFEQIAQTNSDNYDEFLLEENAKLRQEIAMLRNNM